LQGSLVTWVERAAERSPAVQRSRERGIEQATVIVEAARRLIVAKGSAFTTQELVKEAGVALKTFYSYFGSKDQLLVAVIEDLVSTACFEFEIRAREFTDPLERLHYLIATAIGNLTFEHDEAVVSAQFITTEHWRLYSLYPVEMERATRPYTELVLRGIEEASAAGMLSPRNPESDAWLVGQLVTTVYHHYAFAPTDESSEVIGERLWHFCLAALGGATGADER
jgi:AcrR family transcriptional regulator